MEQISVAEAASMRPAAYFFASGASDRDAFVP